ncbi:MAG: xanthine dehydrogenase family protein subunit M [Chloroflexota bacterium]
MQEFELHSPKTLTEAYDFLEKKGGKIIAGGTDVIPQLANGRFRTELLVDISYLSELSYIKQEGELIHIGGLTNYSLMINSTLLQTSAPLLVEAAASVGAVQTQNRGTLAGNLGNASPAGDMLPPLLALDAVVTLTNRNGERQVPLAEFLLGPGKTALSQGEIIHHVSFNTLDPETRSTFIKAGNRKGMAISVVNTAVLLLIDSSESVKDIRISLGAVAPTPIRCPKAEAVLLGKKITQDLLEESAAVAAAECSPISDLRASADYRRHAAEVLVKRGIQQCLNSETGEGS